MGASGAPLPAALSVAIDRSRVRRIRASVAMATSSCPAFVSAPRAAVIGAASRAIARRVAPTGAKRRVASTIVPRASADAPPVPAVDIPDTNDEWEAVSPVDFAADVSAALAADKVVILGKRGALRSPGFVASLPESLRTVWLEAVAAVRAGDNGGKRSIMVPWDNGGSLKDVVVGVLPTAVSRHNCPAAAFAVDVVLAGRPSHPRTGKPSGSSPPSRTPPPTRSPSPSPSPGVSPRTPRRARGAAAAGASKGAASR